MHLIVAFGLLFIILVYSIVIEISSAVDEYLAKNLPNVAMSCMLSLLLLSELCNPVNRETLPCFVLHSVFI